MEKLKIYDIIINSEEENDGINFISFVDRPAVEYDFLKFSEDNKVINKFAIENKPEMIALGVIMLADVPIYRNNELYGEHYVVFSKETIKQIILKFFKDDLIKSVNLNHKTPFDGAFLFQSYIIDRNLGINPPDAFKDIPDGSWVGAFKIEDENLWKSIEDGTFNGFSIEGYFQYGEAVGEENSVEDMLKEIHSLLTKIK